eukprot:gene34742-44930_t
MDLNLESNQDESSVAEYEDSRIVSSTWYKISTPLRNSSPRSAEGFRSQLVDIMISPRSATAKVTFGGIISILVSLELNSGSESRRSLVDTTNNFVFTTVSTVPLLTVTDQHLAEFKSCLNRLLRWWMSTKRTEDQAIDESGGSAFGKFFHACLDSELLRAICLIVKPSGILSDSAVLSEFLLFVNRSNSNHCFLYFSQLIAHPGIVMVKIGAAPPFRDTATYATWPSVTRSVHSSVALVAPHFIAICLEGAMQEFVVEAFKNQNMVNDSFCEELLNVACYNQRLPYAFSQLKSLLHTGKYSLPNSCWNASMPNVSTVILQFSNKVGVQNTFILDEKLFGDMIMLVFQMESDKSKVSTKAKTMFFEMLTSLNRQLGSKEEQDDVDDSNSSFIDRFNPSANIFGEYFYDFVKSLGIGRPFFAHFLYSNTELFDLIIHFLTSILNMDTHSEVCNRIQERYMFYDNDHVNPSAVQAMGLRNPRNDSVCLNLTDEEFADLLTVAMYCHDTQNLTTRLEGVVRSMIADQERREIINKFMKWVIDIYVTPDIFSSNYEQSLSEINRTKWSKCGRFRNVSFEDIVECAAEAAISSYVLRSAARSKSHDLLEQLFLHYIRSSDPIKWKDLFRGSRNIAYFIKYVDAEDLDLAFMKFSEKNPENYYFRYHLLRVRKLLKEPIVSAQALIELTSSSDSVSASVFFGALTERAKGLPRDQVELRMAMLLTASWMKISKEKVLFPLPPRNAQIITLLTVASWAKSLLGAEKNKQMGKALIAQVGTGEGKSLIIAMMAIFFVKTMKKR